MLQEIPFLQYSNYHKTLQLYENSTQKIVNIEQNQDIYLSISNKSYNYCQQNTQKSTSSQQPNNQIQKHKKEKKKRIRIYISNNPNNKKGHWSQQQKFKYHYFLESNPIYFIDKQRRKTDKIFKSMSNFIETRQPHQCRSHHQKIQKKWITFTNILLNLRKQNFQTINTSIVTKKFQTIFNRQIKNLFEQKLLTNEQLLKQKIQNLNIQDNQNQINYINQDNSMSEININANTLQTYQCLFTSENYQNHLQI